MGRKISLNPKVSASRALYIYFISSGVFMFLYLISCIFTMFPWYYFPSPIIFLGIYGIWIILKRNWRMIGVYITDRKRGELIMFLNEWTQFSETHKSKLAKWIYPHRSEIRMEPKLLLGKKVSEGQSLSKEEKILNKKKVVFCPQQLLDGINEAFVINAIKHAHINIKAIDKELRDKFNLTDFNMAAFDLQTEINKCKK